MTKRGQIYFTIYNWGKDSLLHDVEHDLEYSDLPKSEQKKALSAVKKALRRYQRQAL